ncbi:MAG TPA: hypothetical protein VGH28_24625 [Polyangiaceae bacterium]|jgi:hypothetical protein
MRRILSLFALLVACAPPDHEVTLAELAPTVDVAVEVGPDNATITLLPRSGSFAPTQCPALHDVSVTFAGLPFDPSHSSSGGSYVAVDPTSGVASAVCQVPQWIVPLAGHTFDPSAPTPIVITDGTATVEVDAHDVFATPSFHVATPDGMLHAGASGAVVVSPAVLLGGDAACVFTPNGQTVDYDFIDGTASNATITLDVPADSPLGPGELDCQLSANAPIDHCDGANSCSVTLNRYVQVAFDATIVSP